MTIYLNPEVRSGLGERTFWDWAADELPGATFEPAPASLRQSDCLLQYSTLGIPSQSDGNTVALLWELYPEMRMQLASEEWNEVIERTKRCAAACRRRVISTEFARRHYEPFGHCDLLPIGVDTDLFRPRDDDKARLRDQYNIPADARVGFWMGTNHRMKGADRLEKYAAENPDIHWIVVWKTKRERGSQILPHATQFTCLPQSALADLMACADFFLACGRLRPFFMVEWECMAADLPMVNISGLEKDFEPCAHPRDDVLARGWDRHSAKKKWLEYLGA